MMLFLYISSYLLIRERVDYNNNKVISVQFNYGDSKFHYALSEYALIDLDMQKKLAKEVSIEYSRDEWPEEIIHGSNWRYITSTRKPIHFWRIYRLLEEIEILLFPPN